MNRNPKFKLKHRSKVPPPSTFHKDKRRTPRSRQKQGIRLESY